jgi:hypothetical protein
MGVRALVRATLADPLHRPAPVRVDLRVLPVLSRIEITLHRRLNYIASSTCKTDVDVRIELASMAIFNGRRGRFWL